MQNPYKTPESDVTPEGKQKTYSYRLFKVTGIGVATFFGTALAGGYLIYRNYKNLGNDAAAKKVMLLSAVATAALFGVSLIIPEGVAGPNVGLTIAQVVVMTQLAKKWFEDDLLDHEVNGGTLASNWLAFGISLLVFLLLLLLVVAVVVGGSFFGLWEL